MDNAQQCGLQVLHTQSSSPAGRLSRVWLRLARSVSPPYIRCRGSNQPLQQDAGRDQRRRRAATPPAAILEWKPDSATVWRCFHRLHPVPAGFSDRIGQLQSSVRTERALTCTTPPEPAAPLWRITFASRGSTGLECRRPGIDFAVLTAVQPACYFLGLGAPELCAVRCRRA